jgi:hypothetical protein
MLWISIINPKRRIFLLNILYIYHQCIYYGWKSFVSYFTCFFYECMHFHVVLTNSPLPQGGVGPTLEPKGYNQEPRKLIVEPGGSVLWQARKQALSRGSVGAKIYTPENSEKIKRFSLKLIVLYLRYDSSQLMGSPNLLLRKQIGHCWSL